MGIFTAKNAGKAFMVVGALTFLGGVLTIILPFLDLAGLEDYDAVYFVILAIGEFISGAMYFVCGKKVNDGQKSKMIDILSYFTKVIGVDSVVAGAIGILTYIFMIIILFDPEVEVAMGIRTEENL